MARHLEFVFGPLGEETRLECACPREANHLRPTSNDRQASREPVIRAERLRPRHRGHRARFAFFAHAQPRHAA
jgi:hypothetical protein